MFASKTPRDLNHDPNPWVVHTPEGYADRRYPVPRSYHEMEYAPRPEFDHVQHNAPNPILVWHRKTTRPGMTAEASRYVLDHWAATIGALPGLGIIEYTAEHEAHARRVLTLAARGA